MIIMSHSHLIGRSTLPTLSICRLAGWVAITFPHAELCQRGGVSSGADAAISHNIAVNRPSVSFPVASGLVMVPIHESLTESQRLTSLSERTQMADIAIRI